MPKLSHHVPQLSRHVRGGAFVKIAGQQVWLGRYGDPLTQEKYDRLVGEWLANGRRLPAEPAAGSVAPTVADVMSEYWTWAKARYTPSESATIKAALKKLAKFYASLPAQDFGPKCLRIVRDEMVRAGWTRRQINRQVSRIRGLFRWAASHEMLHESIYNQLATVESLKRGDAPERPRVKPVPRHLIRAVRPHLSRPIRALIDLQLLTGARAAELIVLRGTDLNRKGDVWRVEPDEHKTAHHEKTKTILFGPRAQRVLKNFLGSRLQTDSFLFSPSDAIVEKNADAKIRRRANQKPNPRKTNRTMGVHYTTDSYRRAVHRAAEEAFPLPENLTANEKAKWWRDHKWGPHRLRHNAATFLRREFGIEVAQIILGHSTLSTTQVYAEVALKRAIAAIGQVG